MKVEKANRTDANAITELTIRSKDHWGYGKDQMEEWRAELTITPEYIDKNQVFKVTKEEQLVGFYAYQASNSTAVKLNFLFVEPDFIGKGYGKILMKDFLKRMETEEYESITLDADPNAERFYRSFGFDIIGKLKTSIKDRFLPIMELKLKPALKDKD